MRQTSPAWMEPMLVTAVASSREELTHVNRKAWVTQHGLRAFTEQNPEQTPELSGGASASSSFSAARERML